MPTGMEPPSYEQLYLSNQANLAYNEDLCADNARLRLLLREIIQNGQFFHGAVELDNNAAHDFSFEDWAVKALDALGEKRT